MGLGLLRGARRELPRAHELLGRCDHVDQEVARLVRARGRGRARVRVRVRGRVRVRVRGRGRGRLRLRARPRLMPLDRAQLRLRLLAQPLVSGVETARVVLVVEPG